MKKLENSGKFTTLNNQPFVNEAIYGSSKQLRISIQQDPTSSAGNGKNRLSPVNHLRSYKKGVLPKANQVGSQNSWLVRK
jgi:hypothetical protein